MKAPAVSARFRLEEWSVPMPCARAGLCLFSPTRLTLSSLCPVHGEHGRWPGGGLPPYDVIEGEA